MAKVLVTGATGFIGNHVARLCVEKGDDVRVMVMPGEDRSPLDGLDVEFVEANLLDPPSLERAVQGIEQLYQVAALYAVWTKDPDLHYKINVDGAESILRAAMAAGVQKVVFTSSIAAIGIPGDGSMANEDTKFNGWAWASDYILSKYISHQMVRGLIMEGLPATIVMPGLPFGPGDRMPTPTGQVILGVLKGQMKNYWDAGLCPVDVRDVAQGHLLAMEKGGIGASYCLTNREANMSQKAFLELVARVAGVEGVAAREVSGKLMLRVAKLAELWSKLTGRAPVTTYKNTVFALQLCFVDSAKAVEELGLPQTPIETAVRDSVEWFRANGYA